MMKRVLIALGVALGGCSDNSGATSPPSGADLISSVKRGDGAACGHQMVLEHIGLLATGQLTYSDENDWNGGWTPAQIQDFGSSFVSQVTQIVRNSYDDSASRISCGALYTAATNGAWFSHPIEYDIQISVDQEPIIAVRNERQLKDTAWRAHHLYYCENIYPEQVQREGTPYGIVCTLDELRRVDRTRLERIVVPAVPAESEGRDDAQQRDEQARDNERKLAERAAEERVGRVEYRGPPVILPGPPPPPPRPAVPDDRPTVIANPSWQRPPQPRFPGVARLRRVTRGTAEVSCRVQPNGALTSCRSTPETASSLGFGGEAVRAAEEARVTSQTVDRLATGGSVTFTIRFEDDQPRGD